MSSKLSKASKQPPFILVDGSSYLFRAFHALPPLTNSQGTPTGAVKGVLNMLRKLIKDYQPEHIAVVFDAKGKTFRNDLYAEYKANRPPMPDDLRVQIEPLHAIIKAMGLPLLVIDDVEADDVIGTLAHQAGEQGMHTLISTGDKDMAQLVNEHVHLINTMSDTYMDIEGVETKFGVRPDQIIDYLTLMGDTVDNIPGVNKCGPKTAVKWLKEYESLDGVIDNADSIKGKIGEHLRNAIPQLPLSKILATIKLDVELESTPSELTIAEADKAELLKFYKELEFNTWIKELDSAADTDEPEAAPSAPVETNYETVLGESSFMAWVDKLKQAELFAFDTETTAINYMQAHIVGVSFCIEPGHAAYVPFGHVYPGAPDQLSEELVLGTLKPLLEDPNLKKVGQHIKYDMNVLRRYDIELQGVAHDTMLESYVLNSTATRHDMDSLALKYLERETIHFEDVAGKGAKQLTFDQVGLEEAGPYAAEDADITLQLHQTLHQQLAAIPSLEAVKQNIELPLITILSKMECHGALIDADMLRNQSQQLSQAMLDFETKAFDLAGQKFNLGSPKQLGEILYEKLEIPVIKKTPKGAPSTAEPVLQELALEHELPEVILSYRSFSKLKSTYTDKLPELIDSNTGRIHTSYHQAVAATGRLSSSDPNLQNIPIRTPEGRKIRQAFIAPPNNKLVAADYSQIELRIMAHLSGDEGLLNAFAEGMDVHKATAAEVFGVAIDEVTNDHRRQAKAINFGLIYGMSAFGLGKQLKIGRNEAQEYIDKYFQRYPGVHNYMETTRAAAADTGYVETLFGRRLYLPEIHSKNVQRRQAAERTAINAPMQGTAADIIKRAMLSVDELLSTGDWQTRMIMQVHDELVFEIPESELDKILPEITSRMETAAELNVPLLVEAGVGNNWDEAH